MNAKKARACRKVVYGEEGSPRFRKYFRHKQHRMIIADEVRQRYQQLKKAVTNGQNTSPIS